MNTRWLAYLATVLATGIYLVLRSFMPFSHWADVYPIVSLLVLVGGIMLARQYEARRLASIVLASVILLHGMLHWGYETNAAAQTIRIPESAVLLGASTPVGPSLCVGSCASSWVYLYRGNQSGQDLLEAVVQLAHEWTPEGEVACDPNCRIVLNRGDYWAQIGVSPHSQGLALEILVGPLPSHPAL
jgi:hypothetical protein